MDTNTQAAPAADAAAYAALAKEYGDNPAPEVEGNEPIKTQEQPPVEAEKKDEKPAPLPYEELEKRYSNLQGALQEERGGRKALKRQVDAMQEYLRNELPKIKQQPVAPVEPDPYADPLDSVQRAINKLAEQQQAVTQRLTAQDQEYQAKAAETQLHQLIIRSEKEYAEKQPDYFEAIEHLKKSRLQEYARFYPDNSDESWMIAQNNGFNSPAELRDALLWREAQQIAQHAAKMGVTPAEYYYDVAKTRGYQPKAAAPAQQAAPAPQKQIATIRKGQEAATSLSVGGASKGGDGAFPSAGELADMFLDDPEKAEAIFTKMKKAGAL